MVSVLLCCVTVLCCVVLLCGIGNVLSLYGVVVLWFVGGVLVYCVVVCAMRAR